MRSYVRSSPSLFPSMPRAKSPKPRGASIADGLTFRPLTVDDLSDVRYLHTLTCRCLVDEAGEEDVEDYLRIASAPEYGELLLSERHLLAFCGDMLVGSAGWSCGPDGSPVARLASVFVHPLFKRLGVARRLVEAVERDARSLGFERLEAPLPAHAGHFLRRLGFVATTGAGVIARAAPDLGLARQLTAGTPAGNPPAGRPAKPRRRKALTVAGQA